VTAKDVERVIYASKDVSIPEDRQIIDIIPRQYIIDGYDEIVDPVGMVGVKLEVETDVIAGKITSVQNIVKSMEKAGLKIDGLIVEALGTSEALLTSEEKEMGVVMIDVGGGVTDISVFKNKKLIFYDSIPVGGDHITSDISIGLKIPYQEAERLKRQYELALTSLIKNDQEISVSELNDSRKKTVKVSEVVEIIEARVQEIFTLCYDLLQNSNISGSLSAGIVLAGGGISYVDGSVQLAYEVFDMPTRIAAYKTAVISKPEYATAVGIVKYVSYNHKGNSHGSDIKVSKKKPVKNEEGFFKKIIKVISEFF
jgi:cell division protein FtsA